MAFKNVCAKTTYKILPCDFTVKSTASAIICNEFFLDWLLRLFDSQPIFFIFYFPQRRGFRSLYVNYKNLTWEADTAHTVNPLESKPKILLTQNKCYNNSR